MIKQPINRTKKDIIVLGSGTSILELSEDEREYINQCEVVIAINKFMAFYEKAKIIPTHIFYVDAYEWSVVLFLKHIFKVCRKNNLKNLTFIIGKKILKKYITKQRLEDNIFLYFLKKIYLQLKYKFNKTDNLNLFLVPRQSHFEFVSHQNWINQNNNWSDSLEKPLFHYRGSLTTVLNYISIKYPNRPIKLVGTDFYGSEYFFQQELDQLNINWEDWSTSITQQEGKHFSAISYQGTTMFDKLDYIIDNLRQSGNDIYCCNPKSLLVTNGYIDYKPIYQK